MTVASMAESVIGKIFNRVSKETGEDSVAARNAYDYAGKMKADATKADIVSADGLTQEVHGEVTPVVAGQIKTRVSKETGEDSVAARNAYDYAGKMKADATKADIVSADRLTQEVHGEVTPIVANQIVTRVGEDEASQNRLAKKYPLGGKMLEDATRADIVNPTGVIERTSERLSGGLTSAQEDSFRSGKWDKLALQKVAEESKLFTPEALATVKGVITDLLESSIRTGINWGDRKGGLDKLMLVQATGLINDEDVTRIRSEYLLRDSLIDAGV